MTAATREAAMKQLEADELRELLVKCWMTHDGTWFFSCMQEYGIEAANRLNKAAIKALAPIELRRVLRALGIKGEGLESSDEVRQAIDGAFSVVGGEFMGFEYDFPQENVLHWVMHRCFALEGMKMMGAYETYECGVLFRVACWLDNLGVRYSVEPPIEGCLMRETGACEGTVTFELS